MSNTIAATSDNSGSVIVESSLTGYGESMKDLTGLIGDLTGDLKETIDSVAGAVKSIDANAIFSNIDKIGDKAGEILGFDYDFGPIQDLVDSFSPFTSMGMLDSIDRIFDDISWLDTEKIEDYITNTLQLDMDWVDKTIVKYADWLYDKLQDIDYGQVGEALKKGAQAVGKALGSEQIKELVKKIGQSFGGDGGGEFFRNLFKGVDLSGVGEFFKNLVGKIDLSGVGDFFTKIFGNLGGNFDFSGIVDLFKDLGKGFGDLLGFTEEDLQVLEDYLKYVWKIDPGEIISDSFAILNKGMKDAFEKLVPDLSDLSVQGVKDYIKNFGPNLRGILNEMGGAYAEMGQSIFATLKDSSQAGKYMPRFAGFALDQTGISEKLRLEKGMIGDIATGVINKDMKWDEGVGQILGHWKEKGLFDEEGGFNTDFFGFGKKKGEPKEDQTGEVSTGGGSKIGNFFKGFTGGKNSDLTAAVSPADFSADITSLPDPGGFVSSLDSDAAGSPEIGRIETDEEYSDGSRITMEQFCDKIEIHIANADGKGYDQIEKEITQVLTQLFDNYEA